MMPLPPFSRLLAAALLLCAASLGFVSCASPTAATAQRPGTVASPDGRLAVQFRVDEDGAPRYTVTRDGQVILRESRLGLVRDDADFTQGLQLVAETPVKTVTDRYEILTAKRRHNTYRAHERAFRLAPAASGASAGAPVMNVVFRVSDDGVAFRYHFPAPEGASAAIAAETRRLTDEVSSFHFLPGTRAWLQPMSEAKTGWGQSNPSYEEYYEKDIPAGTPSKLGAGWVYPALFRSGDTWLLVSETALGRDYCGTRLRHESPDGEYSVGFADPREVFTGGGALPESKLPWATPWRLIVIGDLATVTESMLGVDLAAPPAVKVGAPIEPGKSSWSWPLLGDSRTTYEVQKQFIDYAADMGWRYCLIDALWDTQIGYERTKELVDYARTKGVKVLVWYNSAGDWNTTPQTPRSMLLTRESRQQEFARLKAMGVAGLKIDFFGGDGRSMIAYYHDLLEESAPYGFHMNFHGATLPRGWQRTYPHLMTMESIRGLEFLTFEQANADQGPTHVAMLPFTRNVFDPMDFTPMALERFHGRSVRRTTSASELAQTVLFTSGIQHYAEVPEGLAKAPDYVREFLKHVPSIWDDVKFIDGFPGEFAVLARRGDGRWYLAGVNGAATPKPLSLDLARLGLPAGATATVIRDGDGGNLSFVREQVRVGGARRLDVTLAPRGGFVAVIE